MSTNTALEQQKLVVLYIVIFLWVLSLAIIPNRLPFIQQKSDIFLRWYATNKLLEEDRNLYDGRNGEEIQDIVYGEGGIGRETNFYYPAPLLLVTVPLSFLPYPVAHLIWTTAGQLFFLIGILAMIRLTRYPSTTNQITLLMCLLIIWTPYIQHVIWGQFNTIGVLTTALCLVSLHRGHYGRAGLLTTGLLFKPHTTILTLLFLLFWVFFQPRRWRFYLGFGLTGTALWAFAALFQPNWVVDFINSLGGYIPVYSVVDQIWNPSQITAVVLLLATLALFIWKRHAPILSPAFIACFSLSLTIWALVLPVTGAFHLLILPIGLIPLLAYYQHHRYYRYLVYALLLVYVSGWFGFIGGLLRPEWYGWHITWSELAYKMGLPVLMTIFALPLCWQEDSDHVKR